jgi:hypothetical protein
MLVGKLFEEEQTFVCLYSQVGVVVRGKQTFVNKQKFQENPYYGAVIKRKSGICQMKILY